VCLKAVKIFSRFLLAGGKSVRGKKERESEMIRNKEVRERENERDRERNCIVVDLNVFAKSYFNFFRIRYFIVFFFIF
jgi:hypothetical protein